MASFRERAEADLLGKTAKQLQNSSDTQSTKTTFRERAEADLTKNSHEANAAYKAQKQAREQAQLAEQQQKRQQEQQEKREQLLKAGRQTTRKRIDTGADESQIGEGWQSRADLDKLWGEKLNATAYKNSADAALAKLDSTTPDTTNMNDATRYEQMQEARRRANNQQSREAGSQEAYDAAKWEETQRIGIQGTKDNQLLQNLQQLNELYTTANLGHESVAQTAKEQYDTLYSQLKSQYGEQVDDWAEYVKRLANAESMGEMTQRIANAADESPVVASLATPLVNVASGAGIVDVAAQKLRKAISGSNTPIDYNRAAQLPSNWVTTTRGTVSENIAEATDGWIGSDAPIGNLYSGLYNIGMSMADSVVGQKLGGATIFLGGAAATSAMNEARERGASTDQALAMGLLAGTAETIMEKIPMEKLLSQTNPTSVRSAIKNILSQGASEATEEGLTTLANTISDAIIMGDKSELNTAIRRYQASGYSDDEAQKKAFTDWLVGLAGDAIGGAVSGGLFAAAYNIPGGIEYRRSGGDTTNNQTNSNANANADASSNASSNVEQSGGKGSSTEQTADPLEFAIQETMQPSREKLAAEQAMEDMANWMLGKEKTATADAETGNAKVVADTGEIEPSLLSDWSKARTALIEYARKHFPASVVNNDTGKEIGISRNGLDKFLSGKIVKEKYASGYHIPELIQNAHKVTGANNYHAEQVQDIPTYEYFDSPIEIDGKDYTAHIRVRNTRSGDKYYGHTISEVENIEIEPKAVRVPELDFSTAQPVDKTANSSNFNISASDQNVNQNQQTSSDNDMGAKKSDFKHEVKQSKGKTTPDYEAAHNVPEDARTNQTYDAVTEAETNYNAKLRLEQDYDGELEAMRQKTSWDAQEMSMARMVLEDLWAEADETDSWDAYKDWAKVFEEHKQEGGRALQNLAQINRRTGAGIMQEAASILDSSDLRRKTDADAVLSDISDRSKQFNRIVRHKDVDGLVQLIKDTAAKRNTGYQIRKNGTQKQNHYLNWALKRVSTYAKSGKLTGNVDANLQINASNIQNPDVAFQFLQDFAATGILNIAADTQKVSKGTQVMALRRSGMLSKLATTMRNLTSNSSFNVVDTLARDISVPLDMLISKFTGTRSTSMDYGYLSKAARQGSLDNIAIASLETSLDVNGRDNGGKYTAGGQRTFKMSGNAVERFLSRLEALQGYEMYVTDEMSKGRTQAEVQRGTDKLYEQGKIKAGDDSLRNAGAQTALYRTFQDETALSNATLKMRDALNEVHAGDVGLGDVMLPFAQVPANLADRAIDYSPAGLAKTTGKLVEALSKAKKGEFTAADQARVVQSLGRNITGSAMIGIAAALAANGLIRVVNPGDEDENKDKAAFEKMQGQNGTQWNLSATMRKLNGGDPTWQDGDDLISIAFLEPMNAQLTIGALLAEDMELEGQLTAETALKDSFTGSLTAIMELPMFDTFADAIDAYTYSNKERTGDKLLGAGNTLAANEVASLIPNWMKGVRQGLDPYQRDLYSEDNVWGQVADQYQAVFGKRSELPIKQDSFGQDMTNEGGVKNFLNANILPGYVTKYHTDPLIEEITEIAEATGDNSIFPSRKAPDELSIDGEKVPLTYAEQQAYQKAYGNADEAIRTGLMESEAYDKLSCEEKQKAHGYSETYAKQTAASSVNGDYDADSWVEELQGKTDAEIVEAILYKTFSSIADSDEYSSKYDGMADLVDDGKLSDAMAITMMPSSMQTAYQDVAKAGGVSVNEWLDMYAYAYAAGKTDSGTQDTDATRTAALKYINQQNWSESKKTAAANAVYSYLPNTVRIDVDVPYDWALDQGESGLATVVSNMSESQKENYQKYIEGHFDNDKVGLYMDAYKFKGSAKTIYKDDGETVEKSAKDQVIEYIDAMDLTDREKIRIYLGLGYSINKIPDIWDKS